MIKLYNRFVKLDSSIAVENYPDIEKDSDIIDSYNKLKDNQNITKT